MTMPIMGAGPAAILAQNVAAASAVAGGDPAGAATLPDFGPAAVFTPSGFTAAEFGQAIQYTMYNSRGVAVPLAQSIADGGPPTAVQLAIDPALSE